MERGNLCRVQQVNRSVEKVPNDCQTAALAGPGEADRLKTGERTFPRGTAEYLGGKRWLTVHDANAKRIVNRNML